MLKPDAVHRGLVGTIISRFESRGFKLLAAKFMRASKPLLETHYSDLAKKGFFPELIRYMGSGPVVPMVWQGLNAVKQGRVMLGATNPKVQPISHKICSTFIFFETLQIFLNTKIRLISCLIN